MHIKLFERIDWGTGRVLEQTVAIAEREGIAPGLLVALADVDRPEDLEEWERWQASDRA